jgi:calcineurin-like phosphoesterase family protein
MAVLGAFAPTASAPGQSPAAPAAPRPADAVVVAITPPTTPLPSEAASAGVTRFSFISYGDTRGRHDGTLLQSEHQLVIESMLGTIRSLAGTPDAVRFVLQSGDAVANGPVAAQWNVSYIPLINRLTTEAGVPYFLAVGNHDVTGSDSLASPGRIAGLRHYFAANAKLIPPEGSPRRMKGYPTFGFGFGSWFFLAFDSNIAGDSAQYDWMKAQLEQLDRRRFRNVAVFFHHPPFSSGPHGGANVERPAAAIRARYMPLFRKHHVRLLLAGHEHLFEHWVERYQDATGRYRIDEIVSGGGGAPLYAYTGEPDLRDYVHMGAAQQVRMEHLARPSSDPGANPFHYVLVHVDGDDVRVEVIAADWGRGFAPYRSAKATLADTVGRLPQ